MVRGPTLTLQSCASQALQVVRKAGGNKRKKREGKIQTVLLISLSKRQRKMKSGLKSSKDVTVLLLHPKHLPPTSSCPFKTVWLHRTPWEEDKEVEGTWK